jgi:hypothetical protein
MSRSALAALAAALTCLALASSLARPEAAVANPLDKVCGLVGSIGEGWLGKACDVAAHPKQALGAAKALLSGKPGRALKTLLNEGKSNILSPSGAVGITAIVAWAVGGAHFVLSEIAKFIGNSTSPELTASWFSSVYLRVTGVAALLTLPFLFAAAIQAVLRSDGTLLARAVFGYLPLAFLATAVAAPVAMMLLAVTDWLGSSVAKAAGDQGSHFLVLSGAALGALGVAAGSPFVTFLIALLTAAGGLILWLELLIREAAVYVVVLMLPLVFAAMVWPARRVWAVRSVEVLVALILAKFAIVAVLALAAAALGHGGGSLIVRSLAGLVLVMLGAFAPWVLLRLLPLAEVASAVAGHVRDHAQSRITGDVALGRHGVTAVREGAAALVAHMNTLAADASDAERATSESRQSAAEVIASSAATDPPAEAAPGGQPTSSTDPGPPPSQPSASPEDARPAPTPRPSSEAPVSPVRDSSAPQPLEPVEPPPADDDQPTLPPTDPADGASE